MYRIIIEDSCKRFLWIWISSYLNKWLFPVVYREHGLIHGCAVCSFAHFVALAHKVLCVKGKGFENIDLQPIYIDAPNFWHFFTFPFIRTSIRVRFALISTLAKLPLGCFKKRIHHPPGRLDESFSTYPSRSRSATSFVAALMHSNWYLSIVSFCKIVTKRQRAFFKWAISYAPHVA